MSTVFGKYYAKLHLAAYKPFGYKDSERFKEACAAFDDGDIQ